ncbi:hypothetical protein M231_07251 [Tremella mesenterica]|uniref:Uncharacterized protein n=1 Tax=Tremella mesenterica TaxID=5217 RepID=A0A4Q1BFW3_TREME|nr:hypothetical protein M231_07251 [Tremella mesenterica]
MDGQVTRVASAVPYGSSGEGPLPVAGLDGQVLGGPDRSIELEVIDRWRR